MLDPELELIHCLTFAYDDRRHLQVISRLIDGLDVPLNVRDARLRPAAANQAYLDLMGRSMRQFYDVSVLETFAPADRANGQAFAWMRHGRELARIGRGEITLRVQAAGNTLPAVLRCQRVGRWLVTRFLPAATGPCAARGRNSAPRRLIDR